jgi:predicted phosphodiesterase
MKVQIISDIHLEHYDKGFRNFKSIVKPEEGCDILFLAGDIGNINHDTYKPFLSYVSNNWKEIYYVLGNHEFYNYKNLHNKYDYNKTPYNETDNDTYEDLLQEYRFLMLEYWNIYLLTEIDDTIYHIWDDKTNTLYYILGNIGWSYIKTDDTLSITNDVKYVYTKYDNEQDTHDNSTVPSTYVSNINSMWTLEKHIECLKNIKFNYNSESKFNAMHEIEDKYADKISDIKMICLTHFPFAEYEKTSHANYHNQSDDIKSYYCNDYNKYKTHLCYDVFIAGHTHYSYNYTIKATPNDLLDTDKVFIGNQKGYPGDINIYNRNYNPSCLFDI